MYLIRFVKKNHIEVRGKFSVLTGLDQLSYELLHDEFEIVLSDKLRHYTLLGFPRKKLSYQESKNSSLFGSKAKFDFILLYLKEHPTQDFLACMYGLSQVKISQWISWLLPLLENALTRFKVLPQKSISYIHQNHEEDYIAGDVTEIPVARKQDYSAQKEDYSGKQKQHTSKFFALCSPDQYIHYVSEYYTGSTHDYTIWKEQCINTNGINLLMDLGFYGAEKDNDTIILPFKRPKNSSLSESAKMLNKSISSLRVVIEHAFRGVKKFKIAKEKIYLKGKQKIENIRNICIGLHNLRIRVKKFLQ